MIENINASSAEEPIIKNGQRIITRCIAVECNFYNKKDCICGLKSHLIDDSCDGKECIFMRIAEKVKIDE